jgi:hypothetical protein
MNPRLYASRAAAFLWIVAVTFLLARNAEAQSPLTNGANHVAILAANTTNLYQFTPNAGDTIILRIGTTNFNPFIQVRGPGGGIVASAGSGTAGTRDAVLSVTATNPGAYTVGASSWFAGGAGGYNLRLADIPGAFTVSPGDEGGTLINGAATQGTIDLGDLDMWTFTANVGDSIVLSMGGVNFNPELDLYGPTGKLIATGGSGTAGTRYALISVTATNSGTFTVVASSWYGNLSGPYTLYLAHIPEPFVVSPGDQGGTLTNGAASSGTIDVGDLDMWTFTANPGDSIVLRMGGTNFNPQIDLYGPTGKLIDTGGNGVSGNRDALISVTATNSGTFTVVASSWYGSLSGPYTLHLAHIPEPFVVSPGDQGGALTNGAATPGTIDLGDLDIWTFTANAGDSITLRMGGVNFNPEIDLYGPTGKLLATGGNGVSGTRDALISVTATNSGTFTVVASSWYPNLNGPYTLHLARVPGTFVVSPGDQGGSLVNGAANAGTIDIGDLDMWSFTANAGDSILLRIGGVNLTRRSIFMDQLAN